MLVQTRSLGKRYREVTALNGCTLGIPRGEVFGLLGPNGSGKTTLIRLLMGYLKPSAGSATIDGLDCYRQSVAVHARTSYLPGDARLFERRRGADVLRFFSQVRGADHRQAESIAERLNLDLSRQVRRMSTGMRQKLALSAALAAQSPLIILDEPTANLDPTVRGEVLALVAEAKAAGRTVIFSSHVLSEIEHVCDRVVILRHGHLVHEQAMHALRRQHRIRARLRGPLLPPPAAIADGLSTTSGPDGQVLIETPGELSPLLGWLATLQLAEVTVEPVGLQAVYDRYHAGADA